MAVLGSALMALAMVLEAAEVSPPPIPAPVPTSVASVPSEPKVHRFQLAFG